MRENAALSLHRYLSPLAYRVRLVETLKNRVPRVPDILTHRYTSIFFKFISIIYYSFFSLVYPSCFSYPLGNPQSIGVSSHSSRSMHPSSPLYIYFYYFKHFSLSLFFSLVHLSCLPYLRGNPQSIRVLSTIGTKRLYRKY